MLKFLSPVNMITDHGYAHALVAVDFLVRSHYNDPLFQYLDQIFNDLFVFYDSKTIINFYDSDLNFFLQQLHMIVMFKKEVVHPACTLLESVLIAHCVRCVSNPEHCLSIRINGDVSTGWWTTSAYENDVSFLRCLFHRENISISRIIQFVLPFLYKKHIIQQCIETPLNCKNLRTSVLKRVHHQKVHQTMMKRISDTLIKKKKHHTHTTVMSLLKENFNMPVPFQYNEFLTRIKQLSHKDFNHVFYLVSRAVAHTQHYPLLFHVLSVTEKKFETKFFQDFLIYRNCAEPMNFESVVEVLKKV